MICEVCGGGDRIRWTKKGDEEPGSPVNIWLVAKTRHHALCVRCTRAMDDAVESSDEGWEATVRSKVAESTLWAAENGHGPLGIEDAVRAKLAAELALYKLHRAWMHKNAKARPVAGEE